MTIRRHLLLLLLVVSWPLPLLAGDWTTITRGVDYQEFRSAKVDMHVVRVDLDDDDLMVISTPESEKGIKVSDYAKRNKALVAINGDYFDDKFNPIGLVVGPCGQWSSTHDTTREGVVAIGSHHADVRPQSDVMDPPEDWVETAVSGWPLLVRDGEPLGSALPGSAAFTRSPHPRTAVGISEDGKTLYFVVVDGRSADTPGVTLADLAAFLSDCLEAQWALNLDGGGSSAMWVSDRIVNHPSDGVERPVGDHLAVVRRSDYLGCESRSSHSTHR
jgi:exopolysaccharide biosynthesis protein